MNKVLNPFYSVGKTIGKGVKHAALSAAAVAAYAGSQHFLVELLPVVIGTALPAPFDSLVSMLLAGAVAGGIGAVENFRKNYKLTPEELEELLKAEELLAAAEE